ncbi:MAG: glycosyltransferase [Opitutaceae bacterium]|jgi:glycosyltransferase involved in cell wall biosynthesis
MLLVDLTNTSHTRARTGIQRVARQLQAALCAQTNLRAVCYDPYQKAWRPIEPWEEKNLAAEIASATRGASWPWPARLRGALRRHARSATRMPEAKQLIVPEPFSPAVATALPALFARVSGPRAALFHDAIALKLPELTPTKNVARFPGYLRDLLAFDGIAAISEDSRQSLLDYWRWLGVVDVPPVQAIPLGLSLPASRADKISDRKAQVSNAQSSTLNSLSALTGGSQPSTLGSRLPALLCVGSIEGRKNHAALLEACEQLWAGGLRFELRLIGLAHPQTGRAALDKIAELKRAGRPLRYEGPVDDATVAAAYPSCQFTLYPSLMEGFGLPVLESLAYGKPCVCSNRGALGEAARGGGCCALDSVDAESLAAAIRRLLQDPAELAALAAAARARTFKSWPDYASELTAWLATLPRRAK